jgi:branched-chain amino acid transport system substrate-binding protein
VLLGGDGWDSPDLIKIAGNAMVGGYFTNHYSPDRKDPVADNFIKTYRARYGAVPDAFAALSYDATMMLMKAIDTARKPTSDEIVKALGALKNYRGVTGTISFDANGDAVKSVVMLRVEKDGFAYVATVNP